MADAHLNLLGEQVKSLVDEVAKEGQVLEDIPVALLEVLFAQSIRQVLNETPLLLNVELLLDVDALLDEVGNLPLQIF